MPNGDGVDRLRSVNQRQEALYIQMHVGLFSLQYFSATLTLRRPPVCQPGGSGFDLITPAALPAAAAVGLAGRAGERWNQLETRLHPKVCAKIG